MVDLGVATHEDFTILRDLIYLPSGTSDDREIRQRPRTARKHEIRTAPGSGIEHMVQHSAAALDSAVNVYPKGRLAVEEAQ